MARPVTLFTGQWADLPLEELARMAADWGYDGLELACWGDHFDPELGASYNNLGYILYLQKNYEAAIEASGGLDRLTCIDMAQIWAPEGHKGFVSDDVCDLGIVGRNVVEEKRLQRVAEGRDALFDKVYDLDFGHCRLSLAAPDERPFDGPESLQGVRIGVPRAFFYDAVTPPGADGPVGGLSPAEADVMARALAILRIWGAVIVDPADLPSVVAEDPDDNQLLFGNCFDLPQGKGGDKQADPPLSLAESKLAAARDQQREQGQSPGGFRVQTIVCAHWPSPTISVCVPPTVTISASSP